MNLDFGVAVARCQGYALPAGIALQVIACLMNDSNRLSVVQAGVALVGIVLMVLGFDHLAG